MIFTSLSPNTQKDDTDLVFKVLTKFSVFNKGGYVKELKKWFKKFFYVKYVSCYESARTALYFILKEMGIKENDEVAIQAFTCIAAVNPIKWIKAKPVFIDINPKNFNMDFDDLIDKVNGKTKAIIFQHTFGCPDEIEKVLEFAKGKKIYLIEDCAHTIGTEYKGKKLGTIGDASIFSLGRDKAISGSSGGVAVSKNRKLGKRLEEGEKFLSNVSLKWIKRQLLYTIIAFYTRKFYDTFLLGKLIHFLAYKFNLIDKGTTFEEKTKGAIPFFAKSCMPEMFAYTALNQLKKIPKINKKRLEIMNFYFDKLKSLKNPNITLPLWETHEGFYPLRFPLLVKKRNEFINFAYEKGVLLGDWYDKPVAPKEVNMFEAGYKTGSCPNAEKVCEEIINLPIHINLSDKDLEKTVKIIEDFYNILKIN